MTEVNGRIDRSEVRGIADEVKRPLLLALAGFAGLVLLAVLLALFRGDSDGSDPVIAVVLLAIVGVVAYGLMITGGILAAIALRSGSMESGAGRVAVRAAVALGIFLPLMALVFGLLAVTGVWEGDSGPILLIWIVLALGTSVTGFLAPEPGRRGVLVFPFLVGVAALVLLLSELTGIT